MRQYDMSTKELVRSYYYDDIYTNRDAERKSVIKGRTVVELGTKTATSFVGNLYRVFDQSVKSFKYLLLVGVARQNPDFNSAISVEEAMEAASLNAQLFPVLTFEVDGPFENEQFYSLCYAMTQINKIDFIKTDEEKQIIKMF